MQPEGGVSFRVWAGRHERVRVVLEGMAGVKSGPFAVQLKREENGYFSGLVTEATEGSLYRFRLDEDKGLYPDPASRFQPEGPHGPSQVIDPDRFRWHDEDWGGSGIEGQVFYEMHVGTFTPEGTWTAASAELEELCRCGVTVIEHMPATDFPGRFGWGYDGVDLFAPTRLYGTPDDFRTFVDAAHRLGMAVVLDVVCNHLGPEANCLPAFSDSYFTDRYANEWGKAINFDGPESGPVREFFVVNALCWIEEFHLDGLRFDATQSIFDNSPEHILATITDAVRRSAGKRRLLLTAENEPQLSKMARPRNEGGYGMDALWNDDFHHTAQVALSGRREAYYTDYLGSPQEFISSIKRGYLYQGQHYAWQNKLRGTPACGLSPAAFILFLENHDQVANSCCGQRAHQRASPALLRAMTALLLLAPGTPLLFQGQEFAASAPFLYFADLPAELSVVAKKGRREFLSQFPSLTDPDVQARLPDPNELSTFLRCKLNVAERETHSQVYSLHKDLLRLRREDPVFRLQKRGGVDGAVLGEDAFVLRFFGEEAGERLLTVNLGSDLRLAPAPEPLLAPPEGQRWKLIWSSEEDRYGGSGTPPLETDGIWTLPGRSSLVFAAKPEGGRL